MMGKENEKNILLSCTIIHTHTGSSNKRLNTALLFSKGVASLDKAQWEGHLENILLSSGRDTKSWLYRLYRFQ